MQRLRIDYLAATLLPIIMAAACGNDNKPSVPTAPTTSAAPTVSSVAIIGAAAIRTGSVSSYTATATLSNGTTQTVTPAWTSSSPAYATVDASGQLTGLSHGSTTLSASYQGISASKSVSIVNNYDGAWTGMYVLRVCDQSGVFAAARWCQGLGGVGSVLPVRLAFTQSGADQNQVAGSISLGTSITGNVSGTVTSDGRLNMGGSFNVISSGVTFVFAFGGWDTRLVSQGRMEGRWAQNQTAVGVQGNAYQEVAIVTMTQASQSLTAAYPRTTSTTWDELFRGMRRGN